MIDIGHHPDESILNDLPKTFDLIGSTYTCYIVDTDSGENNVFDKRLNELKERIKNWHIIVDDFEYDHCFDQNTKIIVNSFQTYHQVLNYKHKL